MSRLRLVALPVVVLLLCGGGLAWAAFSATSDNPTTIRAVADFIAPDASAATLAKTAGTTGDGVGTAGFLRQGGTFRVYAKVTDSGNPASGTGPGTVTADLSTLWASQTAVALDPLPVAVTVDAQTYTHRSAALTLPNPTAASASRAFSLRLTDLDGNTRTRSAIATVAIDNTAPTPVGVQTANRTGGAARTIEADDTITYTFSEMVDPASLSLGWDGRAARNVRVTLTNNDAAAGGNDAFRVLEETGTARVRLGGVSLARNDYVTANVTMGTAAAWSTMTVSGAVVTIRLGAAPATGISRAANTAGTMQWQPSLAAGEEPTDRAGNVLPNATAIVNEPGTADTEF